MNDIAPTVVTSIVDIQEDPEADLADLMELLMENRKDRKYKGLKVDHHGCVIESE